MSIVISLCSVTHIERIMTSVSVSVSVSVNVNVDASVSVNASVRTTLTAPELTSRSTAALGGDDRPPSAKRGVRTDESPQR